MRTLSILVALWVCVACHPNNEGGGLPSGTNGGSTGGSTIGGGTTTGSDTTGGSSTGGDTTGGSSTGAVWLGAPGNLADFTWQDPATAPDASHAGAYGGIDYAPNGDLYLFYATGVSPNDSLKGVIRRNGSSSWLSESFVGNRSRTAHVYFSNAGEPHLTTESGGSVYVFTSANYATNSPTWDLEKYFQANDGNPDGFGAFDNAFLTVDGANFNLFYTYLYYSVVTGASLWGRHMIQQSGGQWPANGDYGTPIDSSGYASYYTYPRGVSGAFQDNQGNILLLGTHAYVSTNHGSDFTRALSGGAAADSLDGVSGASQNATDGSIVLGNLYQANGAWALAVWGTTDYGATFAKLKTFSAVGIPYRVKIVSVQNLIVIGLTVDGGAGESQLLVSTSYDGGLTFSGLVELIDATDGGHPTYSLGSVNLTARANTGSMVLAYSLIDGTAFKGVYLKEFH